MEAYLVSGDSFRLLAPEGITEGITLALSAVGPGERLRFARSGEPER